MRTTYCAFLAVAANVVLGNVAEAIDASLFKVLSIGRFTQGVGHGQACEQGCESKGEPHDCNNVQVESKQVSTVRLDKAATWHLYTA